MKLSLAQQFYCAALSFVAFAAQWAIFELLLRILT